MKEKSMVILKEYIIAKHNAPNDVPDESVEDESDGEVEDLVSRSGLAMWNPDGVHVYFRTSVRLHQRAFPCTIET